MRALRETLTVSVCLDVFDSELVFSKIASIPAFKNLLIPPFSSLDLKQWRSSG